MLKSQSSKKARQSALTFFPGQSWIRERLAELIPDFVEQGAPLESPVKEDYFLYLTAKHAIRSPITPPPLKNHGYYIVSLNRLTAWLGEKCEEAGVNIFPEFPGADLLYDDDDRVIGVRTGDKGIDKEGKRKANYEPGVDLQAKVTVLGEGPRGSLDKTIDSNVSDLTKDGSRRFTASA